MNIDVTKLNIAMARACLDVKALSDAADVGKATLVRVLHGRGAVRRSTVGKLARALGVDVTEILAK